MPKRTKTAIAKAKAKPVPPIDPAKLDQIIGWVVSGATEHTIREAIAANLPDIDAQAGLLAAMTHVAKHADADPQIVRAWTFESARELYRRMVEANDFAGALKALKFLNDVADQMAANRTPDE